MTQNVISQGDHDVGRSRSQFKTNGTTGFLDFKNIQVDTEIVILSALVQKLRSKMSICIMVANISVCVRHTFKPIKIFLFID